MKLKPMIAAAALLLSCVSCSSNTAGSEKRPASQVTEPTEAPTEKTTRRPLATTDDSNEPKIRNYMTPDEKRSVSVHALTLLDRKEDSEHTLTIEVTEAEEEPTEKPSEAEETAGTAEETTEETADAAEDMTEAPEEVTENVTKLKPLSAAIDGCLYHGVIPPLDYNGGEFTATVTGEDGESVEKTFADLESYIDYERDESVKRGDSSVQTDSIRRQIRFVFEKVQSGEYDTVQKGKADWLDKDPFADYRSSWKYDAYVIEQIKDSVEEIELYDEKLDRHFLVEVTLPPGYDENRTYPVLLLTDAVYWFGCVPDLYSQMERGETEDVIIAALGYDYGTNGASQDVRVSDLLTRRADMHAFIVCNLMPLLGEMYNVDYSRSTLFGHSCGGVFTHYALMNEDYFDNFVFGNYAIASPVFWALNVEGVDGYPGMTKEDYGFFETHDKLEKRVYLCAGSDEDPDFEEYYNGSDSTVKGTEKLKQRLEEHGTDLTYKLYPSHHDQYVPSMLGEMMKEFYPPAGQQEQE